MRTKVDVAFYLASVPSYELEGTIFVNVMSKKSVNTYDNY